MKRFLTAVAASALLVAAGAANAHDLPYGQQQGEASQDQEWNNGGADYSQFQQEYDHILQSIRHSMSDGSLSRRQGAQFYRELQSIKRAAYSEEENGDYNSGWVQERLEQLHNRIHATHDREHQQNRYRYGYGQQGYGYDNSGRNPYNQNNQYSPYGH